MQEARRRGERERRKGQSGFSWQMESRLSLRNYGHSHYTGLWYYVWPGNLVEPFGGSMRSAERERERDAYGEFGWKSASGYWSRMEKIIEHLAGAFERFVTPSTIRMRFAKFRLKRTLQVKQYWNNIHVSVQGTLKCCRLVWSASEIFKRLSCFAIGIEHCLLLISRWAKNHFLLK